MKNRDRKGISLAELLVVLSIFTVMLGVTIIQLRTPRGTANSNGLAPAVVAELRSARLRAMSQGQPVAVVFPSAGGSRPHSQALYTLEGWATPHVAQVHNYSGEFPQAFLFVGNYASSDTAALAPNQAAPLDLNAWLNPATKDYVVAFAADGRVVTNDLPWFNGELRVVVCSGLQYAGGAAPSGSPSSGANQANYYDLTEVYHPQTICISRSGTVSLEAGLKNSTSVTVQTGIAQPLVPPAAPPLPGAPGNSTPQLLKVEAFPKANQDIPNGYSATISGQGYVTLVVRALDPDSGDRLSCQFTSTGGGQFSQLPGGSRMRFDPDDRDAVGGYPNGCWKSVWIWTPPKDPNDYNPPRSFDVTCTVMDDRGNAVTASGSTLVKLLVRGLGKVVFAGNYQGARRLFSMPPDGSSPTLLSDETWPYDCDYPSVSPDGQLVAYCANATGGSAYSLYMCNADGTGNKLLVNSTVGISSPTWSPTGNQLCYTEHNPLGNWLRYIEVSAPGTQYWVAQGEQACWSRAMSGYGRGRLTYIDWNDNVVVCDPPDTTYPSGALAPTGPPCIPPDGFALVKDGGTNHLKFPAWDPNGSIDYWDQEAAQVSLIKPDGTGQTSLLAGTGVIYSPLSFSPDASKVVYAIGGYGVFCSYTPVLVGQQQFRLFPDPTNIITIVGQPQWSEK